MTTTVVKSEAPDFRATKQNRMKNADLETSAARFLSRKKQRINDHRNPQLVVPPGFLAPLITPINVAPPSPPTSSIHLVSDDEEVSPVITGGCKQFWKAGDYEGTDNNIADSSSGDGIDRVRVHPKFLHSNATSHKWALGAFAELLDNSLDEVCFGASYAEIDMLINQKDGSKMLLVQDDGGGMTVEKLRKCMSLGYSVKSKMANTIGQYGNGFKTSTMRLGADVIVFSRCKGADGKSKTQTIGLLSYSFLTRTGKQDIVVPMVNYVAKGNRWSRNTMTPRSILEKNLATIVQWSPYQDEEDLLKQFDFLEPQGTRIIIYNLWEDDEDNLELDFDTDPFDIQIRGANRDQNNIDMARKHPNSSHFFTYRHSLRSYASILYLKLPSNFRIILRGKEVKHHNIVDDMMMVQDTTYKPVQLNEGRIQNGGDMVATVKLGFVKDAHYHIDIQGFNVYHKNRLIKPFWRLWNPAGSDGRGVIGVLEANFVEPAHDKQGFERTAVLARLENRLIKYQKNYWTTYCHEVGYAPRRHSTKPSTPTGENATTTKINNQPVVNNKQHQPVVNNKQPQHFSNHLESKTKSNSRAVSPVKRHEEFESDEIRGSIIELQEENNVVETKVVESSKMMVLNPSENGNDRCGLLEAQLEKVNAEKQELNKEVEALIEVFSEERDRRTQEEDRLRNELESANKTIHELKEKIKKLEAGAP